MEIVWGFLRVGQYPPELRPDGVLPVGCCVFTEVAVSCNRNGSLWQTITSRRVAKKIELLYLLFPSKHRFNISLTTLTVWQCLQQRDLLSSNRLFCALG